MNKEKLKIYLAQSLFEIFQAESQLSN